jgi:hypothetical protein
LRGTSNYCITYNISSDLVCGYVDSDFVGDLDKRRSTSCYVFTLAGGAISWMSKLHNIVALSTIEAEYVVVSHACKESIWLKGLLGEFGRMQDKIKLFCDSQSAIHLDKEKIHTKVNCVDMFTKPVLLEKL